MKDALLKLVPSRERSKFQILRRGPAGWVVLCHHRLSRSTGSRGKVAPLRKWRVPYEVSRGGRYPGRCSTITVTARQDCGARGQALEILKKRGFKPENIRIHLRLRPGAVV